MAHLEPFTTTFLNAPTAILTDRTVVCTVKFEQSICSANLLTGFYMMGSLLININMNILLFLSFFVLSSLYFSKINQRNKVSGISHY